MVFVAFVVFGVFGGLCGVVVQSGDMRRVHVCGRGWLPQLVSPNLRFEVKRVFWATVQWANILLFTSTRGSAKGCKGTSPGKILENLVAVGRVGRDEQFRAAPSIFSALLLPPRECPVRLLIL